MPPTCPASTTPLIPAGERGFGRIAATADGVCGLAAAYQVGAVSRVAGSGQGKFYRSSLHSTGGGGKSG